MTDSMKFGPEWLRNMSAEPSVVGPNNLAALSGAGGTAAGIHSALPLHSLGGGVGGVGGVGVGNMLGGHSHARNMFPEYRYGREEMLSLFDRHCLLPQILPSFKKLFVEKVQYPLALTPSSEEELNSQSQLGSGSRPAWQQRSPGGFGIPSRGSGRGGTVERGRMRGKSVYHSMYQRPSTIYDDGLPAISMKPDRNWSERNGTGDSAAVGVPPASGGGGGAGLDWNGTPSSSPRKDFSSHNRNLENWRRNRNEDGSGDGPTPGSVVGPEVAGWRSGGSHRWGRSTSWRDEESMQGGGIDGTSFGANVTGANIQRSISVIGTVAQERTSGKTLGSASARQLSSKCNQSWPGGTNAGGPDGDDNLPEWAMENPSEMGGTFDSSGAFHGDSADAELVKSNATGSSRQQKPGAAADANDESKEKLTAIATAAAGDQNQTEPGNAADSDSSASTKLTEPTGSTNKATPIKQNNNNNNVNNNVNAQEVEPRSDETAESTPTHKTDKVGHGDISERFKEVADEVEKLIMDDDGGVGIAAIDSQVDVIGRELPDTASRFSMPGLPSTVVDAGQLQHQQSLLVNQHNKETAVTTLPLPFADQLAIEQQQLQHHLQQHHLQHHQQQQQQLPPPPPPHVSEMWFYRDPQSNVQGPFSAIEMTEWYRAGYFNENLFVRRYNDMRFRPLGELIKLLHGNMPFTNSHLLPLAMDLDNPQINLGSRKPSALALPLTLNEQQQQQQHIHHQQHHHFHRPGVGVGIDEQLKANVTAAADSLSAAVKGHISAHTMDTSHMLTMRFQMLQDQYLQHQEYQILSELSKSEVFQRMDAAQREAVVRSKVQMLVLPDYLSSFSGLSNCLAALNPIAGSQLYDAIAQQAKKDQQQQIFTGSADQRPEGNFLDANNFIINAQLMHQQTQTQTQAQVANPEPTHPERVQHQFGSEPDASKLNELHGNMDLLNEYNLRMLLRGPSAAAATAGVVGANQQQQQPVALFKPNSGVDFMTESQLLAAQNIIMPMWPHQQQQQQQSAQAWPAMPNAKVTLWDVATLEEEQNQQLLLQQQQQQQKRHLSKPDNVNNSGHLDFDAGLGQQGHQDNQCKPDAGELASNLPIIPGPPQQTPVQEQLTIVDNKDQQAGQATATGKQQQANKQQQQLQQQQGQKQQQQQLQQGKQPELKQISEEERRREQVEEKRRLKEERKRQQQEEEKRRAMLAEEEKNRQQQEEKERQQQIQAQRRKALLGNTQATAGGTSGSPATGAATKPGGGKNEQQQPGGNRSHATSIAPWSLQAPNMNNAAPGLAEIQKAERRERRADQQRQQEQLDKQMRATAAAAAEANDALLKWQASPAPAPVMSLVDIQAEEAKRLANEMLEQQRRREHEQQQQQATLAVSLPVSGGLANIWGSSNKAWSGSAVSNVGSAAASAGLWDDPAPAPVATPKYVPLGTATTAASVLAAGLPAAAKPQSHTQPKSSQGILPSPRNLRKSQTLPTMQNVLSKNARTASGQQNSQQQQEKIKVVPSGGKATPRSLGADDKKSSAKSQQQSGDASSSKVSEYENEFTTWCMKSLDNMSAKVDVPTFVAFLQDLEAPYEVKDYVRIYLGEGKESTEFAKQFLERRSKYKSLQRAQNAHNDDMCKPAPAITPSCNDNGDNKNKQKKIKKNKMTKMDARILGFSVTAAEGRINVGGRDYVDGP